MSKKRVPDDLLLAAMDRAQRHRAYDQPGVPIWDIKRHLGLSRYARGVHAHLDALIGLGVIEHLCRSKVDVWALTCLGYRRLRRAQRSGVELVLPESPQHEAWRKARSLAEQGMAQSREALRECLREAERLLSTDAASDAWFDLTPRLHSACWRFASATYCLREWLEPDDSQADVDELTPAEKKLDPDKQYRLKNLRTSRRNPRYWLAQDD
jgi:hypothetical protein